MPPGYWARVRREWALADRIVVNSAWSRDALVAEGVPRARLSVVPLCCDPPGTAADSPAPDRPLRVLWMGRVDLMKGFPYFVQALEQLPARHLDVTVAGTLCVRRECLPSGVTYRGAVPYGDTDSLYAAADVLVAPTLSDGFGRTQLEAMRAGVPVITTPHCGAVVTDGVDGFVVPARDPAALAGALERLLDERARLGPMRAAARAKASAFSFERYAVSLLAELDGNALPEEEAP